MRAYVPQAAAVPKTASSPAVSPAVAPDPRASSHGKKIGILIVAYNAVNTLVRVLQRIRPDAWDNVGEVVVFDDASQDNTYELAVGFKQVANIEKLQVIRHPKNLGYGGNQKAGYQYFIEKGYDAVVLLHGDGQYAPEILSHLYHPIVSGEADAVFGSRMMTEYGGALKGGMPLYKYIGNRILTAMENRALGLTLSEFHSGYRAYSVAALKQIDFTKMTDDFHFDTEIIIKLHHQGFRIAEVPIPTYYGDEICYVNGFKYALDVTRAIRRYRDCVNSIRKHPEFEEYWVHYPVKESRYSSHYYLWKFAGSGNRILDIGCGEAFLASKVAEMGNRVTGVDVIESPRHRDALEAYYRQDLFEGLHLSAPHVSGPFDRILLLDVLEHLPYPERILAACRDLLAPQGRILVSVPNIANITVRLGLLFGRFEYTERGILDRTHLRFYTRSTARRFVQQHGFEVTREVDTVMPVELALGVSPHNPLMRAFTELLHASTVLMPGLLGYQCLFELRKK